MAFYYGNELKEFNRHCREIDGLYHNIAAQMGLSDSAFCILYDICELGDGCLQKDICDMSFTSKQTINSSIRKLEKEGYIHMEQGKGRQMHIYLTDSGRQLMNSKIGPVVDMENSVFAEMSPEDSRQMLALMHKQLEIFRRKAAILLSRPNE